MKYQKGITGVELLSMLFIVCLASIALASMFVNNMGATEKRTKEAALAFMSDNDLTKKRLTCSGDSDGDGYGSCTLVTTEGEKIQLQCVSGFMATKLWGATGCKEVDMRINGMNMKINNRH